MTDAYQLLTPTSGDRLNKAFFDYLQDGIDRACEDHYIVVPLMAFDASNMANTGYVLHFTPYVDITPMALSIAYFGGGGTTDVALTLGNATDETTVATVDPGSGANQQASTTSFSESPLLTSKTYRFRVTGTNVAASSAFAVLRYRIAVTRETFTDDSTTITATALNNLEENVRKAGVSRCLAFGPIVDPFDTGNATKARFKLPDPGNSAFEWRIKRFAVHFQQMDATVGNPSARYAVYDASGTITSADVTVTGGSTPGEHGNAVDPDLVITAGDEYTVRVVSTGGTSPTADVVMVILWLELVYTKQSWATSDFIGNKSGGVGKLELLDKAIQTVCRWHVISAGYINQTGTDRLQHVPTSGASRLVIEQLQMGYRVTAGSLAAETFAMTASANSRSLSQNATVPQNTTGEALVENTTETALGNDTPDEFTLVVSDAVGATGVVRYLNGAAFFEVGPASITKETAAPTIITLPIVGDAVVNQSQVGSYSVSHTRQNTDDDKRIVSKEENFTRNFIQEEARTLTRAETLTRDYIDSVSRVAARMVELTKNHSNHDVARGLTRQEVLARNLDDDVQRYIAKDEGLSRSFTQLDVRRISKLQNSTRQLIDETSKRVMSREGGAERLYSEVDERIIQRDVSFTRNHADSPLIRDFTRDVKNQRDFSDTSTRDLSRERELERLFTDDDKRDVSHEVDLTRLYSDSTNRGMARESEGQRDFTDILLRNITREREFLRHHTMSGSYDVKKVDVDGFIRDQALLEEFIDQWIDAHYAYVLMQMIHRIRSEGGVF